MSDPNPRVNHIDYVELPAPSGTAFTAAKQFYSEVFGWTYQDWGPDYADTQGSGIGSGINADPAHQPAAPLVVLFVTEIEAAKERVQKAGGTVSKDIFSFPGGRRFHYIDPAGNELAVWSDK